MNSERSSPLISVLFPVYNSGKFLKEGMQSLLRQTVSDFEILALDDASTDSSIAILEEINDPRIQIIRQTQNLGVTANLNSGIPLAKGKFIARMDADDLSHPKRFQKQLELFSQFPDLGMCGTWAKTIGQKEQTFRYPCSPQEIQCALLLFNPIAHSSVMIRADLLRKFQLTYSTDYKSAQDYELWNRISKVSTIRNIPEPLISYRIHDGQVSHDKAVKQSQFARSIRASLLESLGISAHSHIEQTHEEISSLQVPDFEKLQPRALEWFQTLCQANQKKKIYSHSILKRTLLRQWISVVKTHAPNAFMTDPLLRENRLLTLEILFHHGLRRIQSLSSKVMNRHEHDVNQ